MRWEASSITLAFGRGGFTPIELRKAHIANDKAVMAAYGFSLKMSEEDCVEELMKLYQKMILEEKMKKSDKKSKKK